VSAIAYDIAMSELERKYAPLWEARVEIDEGALLQASLNPKLLIQHYMASLAKQFVDQMLRERIPSYKKALQAGGRHEVTIGLHVLTSDKLTALLGEVYRLGLSHAAEPPKPRPVGFGS
jgi:hypothetical protein